MNKSYNSSIFISIFGLIISDLNKLKDNFFIGNTENKIAKKWTISRERYTKQWNLIAGYKHSNQQEVDNYISYTWIVEVHCELDKRLGIFIDEKKASMERGS